MTFTTFTSDPVRTGIGDAVEMIGQRIAAGHKTTAIVAPPRYGKSNIMRLAALELTETGVVAAVVGLAPWVALRDQLVSAEKIQKMVTDMAVKAAMEPTLPMSALTGQSISPDFFKTFRYLWAMTIHAANQRDTQIILTQAAQYCSQVLTRPLLVMIDECQLVSDHPSAAWGDTARQLTAAGAHVVLLTGTPDRADNIAPYGFSTTEVGREDGVQTKVLKNRRVEAGVKIADLETRVSDRVTYRLDADFTVTLKEAWSKEILARIQVRWFGCKVDGVDLSDFEDKIEAKKLLSKAVREDTVEEEAVALFVEEMAIRRQTKPTAAGIVFVGTDRATDEGKNEHARRIQAKVEKAWRAQFGKQGDIQVATLAITDDGTASTKANALIKRFVGGHGDVIIVKSMGGVGLDVERLKVAVDLSTVRTKGNATQRWLRISTAWPGVKHGTLILPEDVVTRELFEEIVTREGGEFTVSENLQVVDEETIPLDEGEQPGDPVFSDAYAAGASNQEGDEVEELDMADVTQAIKNYPGIGDRFTYPEIRDLIRQGAFPAKPPQQAQSQSSPDDEPQVVDVDAQKATLQAEINQLAKAVTETIEPYNGASNADAYRKVLKRVMGEAKDAAGIPAGTKLNQVHDISTLETARDFLKEDLADRLRHRTEMTGLREALERAQAARKAMDEAFKPN